MKKTFVKATIFLMTLCLVVYTVYVTQYAAVFKMVPGKQAEQETRKEEEQDTRFFRRNEYVNNNCTEAFRSTHFMTYVMGGRIGNQLFGVSALIVAALESCYTPFLSQKLGMDEYIEIRNVSRSKFKQINFRLNIYRAFGIYNGSIAKEISRDHNVTLKGIRESYKYFIHKSELVRSSFVFKQEIKAAIEKYFEEKSLFGRTKVGIHVRRGDFLKPQNLRNGFVVSSLYFIVKSMLYFENNLENKNLAFIVVSDDIQWCKANILAPNTYFPSFNDPGKDLYILTQCDHNIVTTGTYGWMGAWLNETGTVVYDKSYPRVNSGLWKLQKKEDLFPPWWIGL